jgi:hypothetical protein
MHVLQITRLSCGGNSLSVLSSSCKTDIRLLYAICYTNKRAREHERKTISLQPKRLPYDELFHTLITLQINKHYYDRSIKWTKYGQIALYTQTNWMKDWEGREDCFSHLFQRNYPRVRLKELREFLGTSVRIASLRAKNRIQNLLNKNQQCYSVSFNLPSLKMPTYKNLHICKPTVGLHERNEMETIVYAE